MPGRLPAQPHRRRHHHHRRTHHNGVGIFTEGIQLFHPNVSVLHCRIGALFWGSLEKGSEEQRVCWLYCLPPFNGTLSRPVLTARTSSGSSACVCVFPLTSPSSRISSLTFLCVAVISRPPRANVNLRPPAETSHILTFSSPVYPSNDQQRRPPRHPAPYNTVVTSSTSSPPPRCIPCDNKHTRLETVHSSPVSLPCYDAQEALARPHTHSVS